MKNLHDLRIASLMHVEAGQLIKRNLSDLATADTNIDTDIHIKSYVTKMQTDSNLFDKALLQIQKNEETDVLRVLDDARDTSVSILNRQLKVFELSDIPAETAAYNSLKILFDNYKNLDKMNYEAETNAIFNLLQDLDKPEYAPHVVTLNLTNYVDRLLTDNEQFNTHFSNRNTQIAATVVYNAKEIRKTMIQNYSKYANYVLLLADSQDTPYYNDILNIINTSRTYYSDLLARRQTPVPDPTVN